MRKVKYTTTAVAVAALTAGAPLANAGPQTGVCRAQLEHYVSARMGQTVRDIKIHYDYDERNDYTSPKSDAVVYTAECAGYHYFEIAANYFTCETLPHYGNPPNYVYYRSSGDGC